jgi:hypothetical protein
VKGKNFGNEKLDELLSFKEVISKDIKNDSIDGILNHKVRMLFKKVPGEELIAKLKNLCELK